LKENFLRRFKCFAKRGEDFDRSLAWIHGPIPTNPGANGKPRSHSAAHFKGDVGVRPWHPLRERQW
jgi:hypothetical protein